MNYNRGAFTLLELLLVIAIIAVLAGIVTFALRPAEILQDANTSRDKSRASDIEKALHSYVIDNSGTLPTEIQAQNYYSLHDICQYGETDDCVNIDVVIPDYLPQLPNDSTTSSETATGFKLEYDPSTENLTVFTNNDYLDYIDSGATLRQSLSGYWKMDEASWSGVANEVVDSSGSIFHGVRSGNATTVSGQFGNAGTFDGISDFVNLNHDSLKNLLDTDASVSFWFAYDTAVDAYPTILGNMNYSGNWNGWRVQIDHTNDRMGFCNADNTAAAQHCLMSGTNFTSLKDTGTFTHAVITWESSTSRKKIFINGVQDASGVSTHVFSPSTNNFKIAAGSSTANDYKGEIDEVRIYSRILNDDEISALYANGAEFASQ